MAPLRPGLLKTKIGRDRNENCCSLASAIRFITARAGGKLSRRRHAFWRWVGHLAKPLIGIGAIVLLVHLGVLDPALLRQAISNHPGIFFSAVGIYLTMTCVAGVRWFFLIKALGLGSSLRTIFSIHMSWLFFTVLLPGGGGSVVKAVLIYRAHPAGSKGLALCSMVADRVVGLYGLLLVGVSMALLHPELSWRHPQLRWNSLVYLVAFGILNLIVLIGLWYARHRAESPPALFKRLGGKLMPVWEALVLFRRRTGTLLLAVAMTVGIHGGIVIVFWLGAQAIGLPLSLWDYGFIAPSITMVNGLPISPVGLGVGEVAGEFFHRLLGVARGGSEVLAFLHLCMLLVNLSGAPFYIFYKNKPDHLLESAVEGPDDVTPRI